MTNITIVILANSIKHNQHCVAGKCIDNKQWIRPVSNSNGGELTHEQAMCKNPHGMFNVKPLQKVRMVLASPAPLANQPENYVIDNSVWIQNYKIEDNELASYLDAPLDLWGGSDRVPYSMIQTGLFRINQSLYLVRVENLNLYKTDDDRRRASFNYNGIEYNLAVTDPNFDRILQNNPDLNSILCISLGEQYNGNCYKLVATIF